jgi:hypothetical protein
MNFFGSKEGQFPRQWDISQDGTVILRELIQDVSLASGPNLPLGWEEKTPEREGWSELGEMLSSGMKDFILSSLGIIR